MGKPLLDEESDAVKETEVTRRGTSKQIIDGGCIILNITSTVTLVFLNKWYAALPRPYALANSLRIQDIS